VHDRHLCPDAGLADAGDHVHAPGADLRAGELAPDLGPAADPGDEERAACDLRSPADAAAYAIARVLRYGENDPFWVNLAGYGVVWLIQDGLCSLCQKRLPPRSWRDEPGLRDGWSREHVVPRSRGGRLPNNVLLAHRRCNSNKSDKPPTPGLQHTARKVWALWHRALRTGRIVSLTGRGR
jgi:hypothetical protein